MKPILNIILAVILLISCNGNDTSDESPRSTKTNVYNFVYSGYEIKDIVLYKGPTGQKSNPSETYLNTYWSSYHTPSWKKVTLDIKNNSIQLLSGTSNDITSAIKIVNDSIFTINNTELTYIGIFNKSTSTFTLKRSLQYEKKMPRNYGSALFISQKSTFGITLHQNIFGNGVFTTPSEMTESDDEVVWSNIDYVYKKL